MWINTMHSIQPRHDPRAVANYFILQYKLIKGKTRFQLDPINLQNIVYLAEFTHVFSFDSSLCNEPLDEGSYIPFFPRLRDALKFIDNKEVPTLIFDVDPAQQFSKNIPSTEMPINSSFTQQQVAHLLKIWKFALQVNIDVDFADKFKRHFALNEKQSEEKTNSEDVAPSVKSQQTPIPNHKTAHQQSGIHQLQSRVQELVA